MHQLIQWQYISTSERRQPLYNGQIDPYLLFRGSTVILGKLAKEKVWGAKFRIPRFPTVSNWHKQQAVSSVSNMSSMTFDPAITSTRKRSRAQQFSQ